MSDNDSSREHENPRAVPADQRTKGPFETQIIPPSEVDSRVTAAAGEPVPVRGTPSLVGRSPQVAGQRFELTQEKTLVGRSESNDVVIDDGTVSARHAQIVRDQDTWRVINLISTNGTRVNGRNNVVAYLAPGDQVTFGNVEFTFEGDAAAKGSAASGGSGARVGVWVGVILALAGAGAALYFLLAA